MGGIVLAGFTVEMIEGRWLAQKTREDLRLLRTHMRSDHWDALSGKWQA
jgi:hypothetical protein